MKKLTLLWSFLGALTVSAQHMPINTQYMYQGLLVNPAIAGNRNALYASMTHRKQWLGSSITPSTSILSAHTPLKNQRISIGGQVYRQTFNDLNNTGVSGFGAYRLPIGDQMKLSFGLKVGILSYRYNWSNLQTAEANDPTFQNTQPEILPNFGFGTYLRTDDFYLGVSVPEIVNGLESMKVSSSSINYNFMAGYKFNLNERVSLLPNLLIRKIGGLSAQTDLTTILRIDRKLDLALIIRSGGRILGAGIDYNLTDQFQFGYSFDIGTSSNNPLNTFGNHEISVSYEFKKIIDAPNTKFF